MLKKVAAAVLSCTAFAGFAGFVDHGDLTSAPDSISSNLKIMIARKYFPEIREVLPLGKSRTAAWAEDIKKAASGLNVKEEDLKKFTEFVIYLKSDDIVKAPHSKLLEFELYGQGRRELFYGTHTKLPPAWQKLMELPLEQRKYTTIPVLYSFCRHRLFRNAPSSLLEKTLHEMIAWQKKGCADTQGCILDAINDATREPGSAADKVLAFRRLFRKQYANHEYLFDLPEYKNTKLTKEFIKTFLLRWEAEQDLHWSLYLINEESLRTMCKNDPALRDLIVCVGLTNRAMPDVRKVAWEFYRESEINYPFAALKLPLEEAKKLLQNYPEHRKLYDLLIIKKLQGKEKIEAIDKYIAAYPDYASTDNSRACIKLNTHAELNALAGAELFKLGRPLEAAERWLKGCTPEDMGMVAEQVMTIDELKKFCDKHFPRPVESEQNVYSQDCVRENNPRGSCIIIPAEGLNFMLRNLLARRLMREGRLSEARQYFTGKYTRWYADKFFALQEILDSGNASKSEKLTAVLNMAALVRWHGDKLFGTFLEPDNLICNNRYPCAWGTKQKYVKLNKPQLPRYSYRYRAAELYGKAAEMTEDKTLKAQAYWTAGLLIKKLSPETADKYFKKLFAIAPEMTRENWFLPAADASIEFQAFNDRKLFLNGKIENFTPAEPVISPVKMPVDTKNTQALFDFACKNLSDSPLEYDELAQTEYALKLVGNRGVFNADLLSAYLQCRFHENYEKALWFLRRAVKTAPDSCHAKYELGRLYIMLGYWTEGAAIVRHTADTAEDKYIRGLASFVMARFLCESPKKEEDLKTGEYYLERARKAGYTDAEKYVPPHKRQKAEKAQ